MSCPRTLTVAAMVAITLTSCNTRRPARFLIPDGFKGWVKIDFQVPTAKPLRVEDNHWLFNLKKDGRLWTSNLLEGGFAADDFFYVSDDRRTPLRKTESCEGGSIWGVAIGSDLGPNHAYMEWFFVGSEAEYRQQIDPGGRIYIPCLSN